MIKPKIFYYLLKYLEIFGDTKYSRHYKYLERTKIKIPENQDKLLNEIEEMESKLNDINDKIQNIHQESRKILKKYF